MDKILNEVGKLLDKVSLSRTMLVGLLILFSALGFLAYQNAELIGNAALSGTSIKEPKVSKASDAEIQKIMEKYPSIAYFTVLKFNFEKNLRVPIYRAFNDKDLEQLVMKRLNGGDGALPIFIKGDESNNSQMISIIQGVFACDPFSAGGLARVWPDLSSRLSLSCRVSIPPAFGVTGTRGYFVAHLSQSITQYELQALTIDLHNLANQVFVSSYGGTIQK